jgi:hypothetical protein
MYWILVIVSWGLNANSGVGMTYIPGFLSQQECVAMAKQVDQHVSTYEAYCIPQRITATSRSGLPQSNTSPVPSPVPPKR